MTLGKTIIDLVSLSTVSLTNYKLNCNLVCILLEHMIANNKINFSGGGGGTSPDVGTEEDMYFIRAYN